MAKRKFSTIEIIGVIFLIVVAIGASWYLFFFKPLQEDITEINSKTQEINNEVSVYSAKLGNMNSMQAELDEIFAENENPSEIAAFDNSQAVMNQLNDILSATQEYSLGFSNPTVDSSGIARRTVSMSFKVNSYTEAKTILLALEQNHWRCIINSVSLSANSGSENGIISELPMTVTASIVFIESTNITASES